MHALSFSPFNMTRFLFLEDEIRSPSFTHAQGDFPSSVIDSLQSRNEVRYLVMRLRRDTAKEIYLPKYVSDNFRIFFF